MIDLMHFAKIKELKKKGLKRSQVARLLELNRETVSKYWDMDEKEYEKRKATAGFRVKKPDIHKALITSYLQAYPDVSTAQIYDWIKEQTGEDKLDFSERTLRNYVNCLREELSIEKKGPGRQYDAVPELPPGLQGQVDMGECWLTTPAGRRRKVYAFAMVLSHSRQKFVIWQTRPFTTNSFIYCHMEAFRFFGGIPKEIVYDQDRVLTVSENEGDIIYTAGFQAFLDEMPFEPFLCHGFDPESKGKVEAVVKYAKRNFARNRMFTDIDTLNEQCLDWLRRTANAKEHGTTKKVPAEVFNVEKEYLQPVPSGFEFIPTKERLSYPVRKDNVIVWKGCRYRVPKGTFAPGKRVYMVEDGGNVYITDCKTGEIITRHKISAEKGALVGFLSTRQEKSKTVKELEQIVKEYFDGTQEIEKYLEAIHRLKPRYYRDQLAVIKRQFNSFEKEELVKALTYCLEREIYSAHELSSAAAFLREKKSDETLTMSAPRNIPVPDKLKGPKPELRALDAYELVFDRRSAHDEQ